LRWRFAGARNFWGKSLLDALCICRWCLPPVVTGYLLLLALGRRGLIGAWLADNLGIVFAFRWTGAALACGVMSFPLLGAPDPPVDRGDRPPARSRPRARSAPRRGRCLRP
jgi:molybdate transport system permease protein